MVDFLLHYIQDLDIHTNGTKRVFGPIILEYDLDLIDVPSMNTAGDMIPFWGYY